MENKPVNVEVAVRIYQKIKDRAAKYNKEHPEKARDNSKKNYDKMKLEGGDKYKAMLERKRINYMKKKENHSPLGVYAACGLKKIL
jgi:hypothetical protein